MISWKRQFLKGPSSTVGISLHRIQQAVTISGVTVTQGCLQTLYLAWPPQPAGFQAVPRPAAKCWPDRAEKEEASGCFIFNSVFNQKL